MENIIRYEETCNYEIFDKNKDNILNIFENVLYKLNDDDLEIKYKEKLFIKLIELVYISYKNTIIRLIDILPNFMGWDFFFNTFQYFYNNESSDILKIYENTITKNLLLDINKLNLDKLNLKNLEKISINNLTNINLNIDYKYLYKYIEDKVDICEDLMIEIFYKKQNIFKYKKLDNNSIIMRDIRRNYGMKCLSIIFNIFTNIDYDNSKNYVGNINVILLLLNNKLIEDSN